MRNQLTSKGNAVDVIFNTATKVIIYQIQQSTTTYNGGGPLPVRYISAGKRHGLEISFEGLQSAECAQIFAR